MSNFLIAISFFLQTSVPISTADKAVTRDEYISMWKDEAIYQMALHKIPASITLAQGILESGDGNSRLAREGNNHFGIKCHDDWSGKRIYEDDDARHECFRQYEDASDSYEDHSIFLQKKRYESLFNLKVDDYKGWAKGLKECGYATNPKYPQLLIGIIEEFNLTEFDEVGNEYLRKNRLPEHMDRGKTPPSVGPSASKEKHSGKKDKRNSGGNEDRTTITINNNREVKLSDNRIKYVVAKAGDTQESIANDLDLHVFFIRKYNDFELKEALKEGQIVYIQPKRNRASEKSYTSKKGDSMQSISQKFGIKLRKLCKYNNVQPGTDLSPGKTIRLRKS